MRRRDGSVVRQADRAPFRSIPGVNNRPPPSWQGLFRGQSELTESPDESEDDLEASSTARDDALGDRNARVRAPDGMQLTLFTSE
jgi:hypothetical protein